MKKMLQIRVLLLGMVFTFPVYAANPASKEYVDQTFLAIEQVYTDLQQQINNLNS